MAEPPNPDWTERLAQAALVGYRAYRELVEDPAFPAYFRHATPIDVIESLPIGSRPSRRAERGQLDQLRAIPYTFAWTQSRHLLTGFYGLGSGLTAVAGGEWSVLRGMHEHWPFFRALVDNAELALAKAEPAIVARYVALMPEREDAQRISRRIEAEYRTPATPFSTSHNEASCWTTRPGCSVPSPCGTRTSIFSTSRKSSCFAAGPRRPGPDTTWRVVAHLRPGHLRRHFARQVRTGESISFGIVEWRDRVACLSRGRQQRGTTERLHRPRVGMLHATCLGRHAYPRPVAIFLFFQVLSRPREGMPPETGFATGIDSPLCWGQIYQG